MNKGNVALKPNKGKLKRDTPASIIADEAQSNNSQISDSRSPSLFGVNSVSKDKSITGEFVSKRAEVAAKKAEKLKQERKDRKQDMTELQFIWESKMQSMKELNDTKMLHAKWARYMKCDGSPDPVNQREINTYISLRLEDTSRDDAENVLNDSKLDLQLIEEINFLLLDSSLESLPESERSVYKKTIDELQDLIIFKLDMATLRVLCEATILANKESGNLQHAVMNDEIALCVWGNIMKNPRIRSFEFTEIAFTFDIPRILALTDCAIRVSTTKFDRYSPTSKSIISRIKKIEEVHEPLEEVKEPEETEEKEEGADDSTKEVMKDIKSFVMPSISKSLFGEETEQVEEVEQEEIIEDYVDPPTPEPTEWTDFEEEDDFVDLRAFSVLGNIYKFNLLQLPPQPRHAGFWTISQLVDPPEISYLEYSIESSGRFEGGKESKKDDKPPLAVSLVIPSDVLCLEQPHIAHWDYERKMWTIEGFSDIVYSAEASTVSFKTTHFGTFCLLQDTHTHMPFNVWEIRPRSLNRAVFTILTPFIEIQIEIKDEHCCLNSKKNRPELVSISDKWVSPAELILMMKKAGVNIFPNEDSAKFVTVHNKHPLIEERLYQQMALTTSAIAYTQSKWNGKLTDTKDILFQAAEALEDEPVLEESWSLFLASKTRMIKLILEVDEIEEVEDFPSDDESPAIRISVKPSRAPHLMRQQTLKRTNVKRVKAKEGGKSSRELFSEQYNIEKSSFKSNMYHLIPTFASEAAVTRITMTSFQFVTCVHQLLTATKVMTHA